MPSVFNVFSVADWQSYTNTVSLRRPATSVAGRHRAYDLHCMPLSGNHITRCVLDVNDRSSPDLNRMARKSATTLSALQTTNNCNRIFVTRFDSSSDIMAAMGSVSLLSVQARPARQFGIGNKTRSARSRSAVMAVSKVKLVCNNLTSTQIALHFLFWPRERQTIACMVACRQAERSRCRMWHRKPLLC